MKVLISLHDITPMHMQRMLTAEKYFKEWGIEKITYLFVPEFHGANLASQSLDFKKWCLEKKPFEIDWHLHGYYHLETIKNGVGTFSDNFKRKYLTGGEGEFLALDEKTIHEKINLGKEVFESCLGITPRGFVAPAWLFNSLLLRILKVHGFEYTEDHRLLYQVVSGARLSSPVITWATRTWLRKYGSLIVCPTLARVWARAPVLRIALHPHDFDHPETIANIKKVIRYVLKQREQIFWSQLQFPE